MEIRKIEYIRSENKTDCFTKIFRNLVAERIGELDTAHSFMYLFNRFGNPTETTKDDGDIIYDYLFAVDKCRITIHASGKNYVYFNFFAPKEIWDNHINQINYLQENVIKKLNSKNIPVITDGIELCIDKGCSLALKKNFLCARRYLTQEELSYLESSDLENFNPDIFDDIAERLSCITKQHLSKEDKEIIFISPSTLFDFQFKDYPEIESAAYFFISELLKPIRVRDIQYNIKKYIKE